MVTKPMNWLCPSDRHLALRAQLGTGWSFHTNKPRKEEDRLTAEEQEHVAQVIKRSERISEVEQKRIGNLVERLDNMKRLASGSGTAQCLLCGQEFGLLSGSGYRCEDCQLDVCSKCSVDTITVVTAEQIWLCKICSEKRELWKRSGAWFFRRLPSYILPKKKPGRLGMREVGRPGEPVTWTRVRARRSLTHDETSSDEEATTRTNNDNSKYIPMHLTWADTESNYRRPSTESITSKTTLCSVNKRPTATDGTSPCCSHNSESSGSLTPETATIVPVVMSAKPDSNGRSVLDNESYAGANQKRHSSDVSSHVSSVIGQVSEVGIDDIDGTDIEFTSDLGILTYSLHHDSINDILHVYVEKACNLKAMDSDGSSDPYVKCHLLPGVAHKSKMRTKTINKTLNPTWNETLTYHGVSPKDLQNRTLRIAVLDEDVFGFDWIGEHRYKLDQLASDRMFHFNVPLLPRQAIPKEEEDALDLSRGKILLSIRYMDVKKLLHVIVVRCVGLAPMDSNGYSDPYVKLYLKPDKGKNSKKKTQVKKQTLNPEFNEEFLYEVDPATIKQKTLEITVWDYDRATANDFIGGLQIGALAKGDRLQLWYSIFRHPNETFEVWHELSKSMVSPPPRDQ